MNQMEVQVEMAIASNTIGNYFDVSYTYQVPVSTSVIHTKYPYQHKLYIPSTRINISYTYQVPVSTLAYVFNSLYFHIQ